MQLNEEVWKKVDIDFDHTNYIKLEISNLGRVRNTTRKGQSFLKGTIINGYKAVKIQLYRERKPKDQNSLVYMRQQIAILTREIGKLIIENKSRNTKSRLYCDTENAIKEQNDLLEGLKKKYKKELRSIELKRKIYYSKLVHRLVAEYFVEKPSPENNIVGHLDFDKLNNKSENLKWMTRMENAEHQKKSPYVIRARKERLGMRFEDSKVCKLTSTKVMYIKKKLNEGVTLRKLARKFNVSEMQISRIKRGENWGDINPG